MVIIEPEMNRCLLEKVRRNTLYALGYDERKSVHPKIEHTLDKALVKATKTIKPKGIYRILPVLKTDPDGTHTKAGIIRSVRFTRLVDRCKGRRSILFMVVTLGAEPEGTYSSTESIFYQFLLNTVCSELIKAIVNNVEDEWGRRMNDTSLQPTFSNDA
jgi:hypothetical protein